MILGFSHLTLRCSSIDEGGKQLRPMGYEMDFAQNVANPMAKRKLLGVDCPNMNIALYRAAGGLPVELVEYPKGGEGTSFLEPVVAIATPSDYSRGANEIRNWNNLPAQIFATEATRRFVHPEFQIPFHEFNHAAATGVVGLVQRTRSLDQALDFWGSRLKADVSITAAEGQRCGRAIFKAPLKSWMLSIAIVEDFELPVDEAGSLDSPGVACLSFISSNVDRDRMTFDPERNLPTTGSFEIEINRKGLRLEIIHVLPGLYFELLQVID